MKSIEQQKATNQAGLVKPLNICSDCKSSAPEGVFKFIDGKPKFLCSRCVRNNTKQSISITANEQLVAQLKKTYNTMKDLPPEFRNNKFIHLLANTIKKYEEMLDASNKC